MTTHFHEHGYGKLIAFRFLVTVSTLHFPTLKLILDFIHQFSSIVKSSCNDWQLSTDLISLYNFESSVYNAEFVLDDKLSGRSFINITKSNGPRMLPCGTPDDKGDHENAAPSL